MQCLKWIFLTTLVSALSVHNLEAQLLKKLKQRVQEATEDVIAEKAAQKAAQESGKLLDSILDIDPEYQANYEKQLIQMMAAGNENIAVEDQYDFDNQIMYKMTVTEGDKTTVVDYEMWFSENAPYMGTKVITTQKPDSKEVQASVLSVLDEKNNAMIILMEEQKLGQVISMDRIKNIAEGENMAENVDTEFKDIVKTGKTKKIMGYDCDEYVSQNEMNKFSFWVTKELNLFQKNMFFNLSKSLGGNTFANIPEEAQGLMMEMNYEYLNKPEKGSMKVVDIQKTAKTILLKDYQLMSLGNLMQK